MNIETIDDILNELADKMGVYGCCKAASEGKDECEDKNPCCCRIGFMIEYDTRIRKAVINENKLELLDITN